MANAIRRRALPIFHEVKTWTARVISVGCELMQEDDQLGGFDQIWSNDADGDFMTSDLIDALAAGGDESVGPATAVEPCADRSAQITRRISRFSS